MAAEGLLETSFGDEFKKMDVVMYLLVNDIFP